MNIWLVLIGLVGGIVGGMGMGGGTLLVPLLCLLGYTQITVQGINLVCFVPMCVVALIVHGRGKRIVTKGIWYILVPAMASAVLGAVVAHHIEGSVLRIMYGSMLLAVGGWQLVVAIRGTSKPTTSRYIVVGCKSGVLKAKGR